MKFQNSASYLASNKLNRRLGFSFNVSSNSFNTTLHHTSFPIPFMLRLEEEEQEGKDKTPKEVSRCPATRISSTVRRGGSGRWGYRKLQIHGHCSNRQNPKLTHHAAKSIVKSSYSIACLSDYSNKGSNKDSIFNCSNSGSISTTAAASAKAIALAATKCISTATYAIICTSNRFQFYSRHSKGRYTKLHPYCKLSY